MDKQTPVPFSDVHPPFPSADVKLTSLEVACYLRVTKGTLAKWRMDGTGPCYAKLGRRVVYDRRDVEAFVAKRRRGATGGRGEAA